MSNSSLVNKTKISPNKNSPRDHKIDTITIHCVVGQLSVETMLDMFSQSGFQASCNYCIGSDGRVGLVVEEKDRSWCSSSGSNDHRAITIECASDMVHPYAVNSAVLNKLIELITDICKRNGIKKLLWKNDPTLVGRITEQNMTVHRWFANKECCGQYLLDKHPYIVERVNQNLGTANDIVYRVQTGSFTVKANAEKQRDELRKKGYTDAFIYETKISG